MSTSRRLALYLVASLVVSGCFSSEAPRNAVVLVVDDGFDETAKGLAGHVRASYNVRCNQVTGPSMAASDDLPTRRQKFLQRLKDIGQACRLEPGLSAKPPLLADVSDLKARWDSAMKNDDLLSTHMSREEYLRIEAALNRDFDEMRFHGTATAGIITAERSGADLVLIERELQSAKQAMDEFKCIDQASLDQQAELFNDPQFRAELVSLPLSSIDEGIAAIVREHDVQIVNESFGTSPRPALEALLREKNCAPVDLKPLFVAQAEIDRLYEAQHPSPNVLVVQAAGNEGVEMKDSSEYSPCDAGPNHVLVGSYKAHGVRSPFSNFGDCLDVFAQGENVLAPIPGGWRVPLAGTSFSAPMVVRWLIAVDDGKVDSPMARRELLLSQRDENKHLPAQWAPAALVYAPKESARLTATPGVRNVRGLKNLMRDRLGQRPLLRAWLSDWMP